MWVPGPEISIFTMLAYKRCNEIKNRLDWKNTHTQKRTQVQVKVR